MSPKTETVFNSSNHPVDLDTGRTLGPSESADGVDLENPHNAALLDAGLITVTEAAPKTGSAPKPKPVPDPEED